MEQYIIETEKGLISIEVDKVNNPVVGAEATVYGKVIASSDERVFVGDTAEIDESSANNGLTVNKSGRIGSLMFEYNEFYNTYKEYVL